MTKAELIAQVASQAKLNKAETEKALGALLQGMRNILQTEGRLALPGFGVFTVNDRPARTGRNPKTGEPLEIAAGKAVKFKPGKTLKEVVK
ncbi:MAG: HU family DNA-binding protein [Deltaproteobacteria bacterium]|nr:HU family DNA-binding protein [Deltaproteobacteria bacterium]